MLPAKNSPNRRSLGFGRPQRLLPSSTSNEYGTVNLSENASAVVGNVVHQHFYGSPSSAPDATNHSGDRTIARRGNLSDAQVEAISSYDYRYAHWLRAEQRIANTCDWIMSTAEFTAWFTSRGPPILICVGSLGCGKSITTGAIIDWANESRPASEPPVISYYVDAARPQPTTTSEILRAFIKQIVLYYRDSDTPMPPDLRKEAEVICSPRTSITTSIPNLTSFVQQFLHHQPDFLLVVDGIDALPESEVLVFVRFLQHTWRSQAHGGSRSRFLLSCRETLGRCIRLEAIPRSVILQFRIEYLKSDIYLYVDHEVDGKQRDCAITSDSSLINEIKSVLKSNSEKMFLWIHLQVLSLWDLGLITCDQDIRLQLKCLPEGLDEIYVRCLRRIDATNDKRSREIAPRMFRWLVSAQAPLTPALAGRFVSMTPENLPVEQSQLLQFPVTDYCANLVVIDDLTGMVKFPHSSVRDFLSDPDKVPPELSHLSLLDTENDAWCGRICVAYLKYYRSSRQLVTSRSPEIKSDITSSIVKSLFRNALPRKMLASHSRPEDIPYRVPLTMVAARQAFVVTDPALHEYICQNWLTHNISIAANESHFKDFADLCLVHDPALQSWSTASIIDNEHYRRMTMYAVMTNHAPLLQLVRDTLKLKRSIHLDRVFQRYAPGTDSTYLHCAAVLGHVAVMRILLKFCSGNTANAVGTSAAAAAMNAQQTQTFELLVDINQPCRSSIFWQPHRFAWTLNYLELEQSAHHDKSAVEDLLEICAIGGHAEAAEVLLNRPMERGFSVRSQVLSGVLFLVCRNGHRNVAQALVNHGVSTLVFHYNNRLVQYGMVREDNLQSVLLVALRLEDFTMMKILLELRHSSGTSTSDLDMLHVAAHFKDNPRLSSPYLQLLSDFGITIHQSSRAGKPFWWFQYLIDIRQSDWPFSIRSMNYLVRFILQSSFMGPNGGWSPSGVQLPEDIDIHPKELVRWMSLLADDVLCGMVRLGLINSDFLTSPLCVGVALSRYTSRFLQSINDDLLGFEAMGDSNQTQWTAKNTRLHDIDSEPVESPWRPYNFQRMLWFVEVCLTNAPEAPWFKARSNQGQILEFLVADILPYYHLHDDVAWDRASLSRPLAEIDVACWLHAASTMTSLEAYHSNPHHARYPLLMWVRCHSKTKAKETCTKRPLEEAQDDMENENITAEDKMCHELQQVGSDGNFALNFPAGYDEGYDQRKSLVTWTIRKDIWLALHRWNFRCNRSRKKSFTESDISYAARVLEMAAAVTKAAAAAAAAEAARTS